MLEVDRVSAGDRKVDQLDIRSMSIDLTTESLNLVFCYWAHCRKARAVATDSESAGSRAHARCATEEDEEQQHEDG